MWDLLQFAGMLALPILAIGGLVWLLIYSAVFVALPYYAGVKSHNPSGHLETYHPAFDDLSLMTHRLLRFQPAVPAFVPWIFWCVVGGFCVYSLYSRDTP